MQMRRLMSILLLPVLAVFIMLSPDLDAATTQVPEWFRLSAKMTTAPEMGKDIAVKVSLHAIVGNLADSSVRLVLPESWKAEKDTLQVAFIKEGTSSELLFNVTPGSCLAQGVIVVEALLAVPKDELTAKIARDFSESAAEMTASIKAWPPQTKRYADIAFAMFAEESFYPLSADMWLSYDDKLSPEEGFRGPAYFEDPVVAPHQAQTDIEMFDKLQNYMKSDPQLAAKLVESGIDIDNKRHDQLNGLYVLAVKAYQKRMFAEADGFISQFEAQDVQLKSPAFENLKIAFANLKGLLYWAQGQTRLAEDALKKAFYSNRKHPLQRYVLRNIGLLMLAGHDRKTAGQMLDLALQFKRGYTLLEKETRLIGNN